MSIDNYEGSSDSFSFPHNPISYDDTTDTNFTFTNISYQRHHFLVSGGGIAPKSIVLTGHFDGTSLNTNFRSLAKHVQESHKLKKLYFESDKFALCVGKQIKKTHAGGRTNFIDYVATFNTIIGILFGGTQKTYTNGGAQITNEGDVTTFIEEISGVVTNGASDVTVADILGNAWKIPQSAVNTSDTVVIKFVTMTNSGSGIYITEFNYATINGTQTKTVQTTNGFGLIQLGASRTTADITVTNLNTGYTIKLRDGWSG